MIVPRYLFAGSLAFFAFKFGESPNLETLGSIILIVAGAKLCIRALFEIELTRAPDRNKPDPTNR